MNNEQKDILLTTNNPGKLGEIKKHLEPRGFRILSPKELGIPSIDVDESGTTFEQNALLKVLAYLEHAPQGVLVIGDDSGIRINALDGRPGVFSKRIFGPNHPELSDQEIQATILDQMKDIPTERRTAQFITVIAAMRAGLMGQEAQYFTGTLQGEILRAPQGEMTPGFPYAPIFWIVEHQLTLKELQDMPEPERQHRGITTHRQRAISQLLGSLAHLDG